MTKKEVQEYLKLRSVRAVERLVRQKKIAVYKHGPRTSRFKKSEIDAAMAKFRVNEANGDK